MTSPINKTFAIALLSGTALLAGCGLDSDADVEYVALGASDVLGVGATPPTNGYVYLIEEMLESDGNDTDLTNPGIPAAEVGAILDVEVPVAKRVDPDLITIFTGANDIVGGRSPDSFQESLDSILSSLRDDTSAFIVIGDLPDLTQLPEFQENPDQDVTSARVQQFNGIIRTVAAKYSVPVAPLSSQPVADEYVSDGDGFHPNDKGYARMADIFYQIIAPQFADEVPGS